jgi:23S rRNA (uracil1939-C5)-methyltransferase
LSDLLELAIDDLGSQGDGIAHLNGKTLFVPGALAGEHVTASVDGDRCQLRKIVASSPDRVAPPCPHFPTCGGCKMQHLHLTAYSAWKEQCLRALLAHEGIANAPILPIQTSLPGTRRRARLAASHAHKNILLGFNQGRSHHIVNLEACAVLQPELVEKIQALRPFLNSWLAATRAVGDIQITALADGIDVVLIGGGPLTLDVRQDFATLAHHLNVGQLSWRQWDRSPLEPVVHRIPLTIRLGETAVSFPPGSFLQATPSGEKALIDFATATIGACGKVLDLFCGLGGFGLSLPRAASVTFADLDGPAIMSLGRAVHHQTRYQVQQRDLIREPFTSAECKDYDAVLYDPPRGGAKAQTEQLAASKVPQIVAISCDPVSFVRDAKILMQNGYQLMSIQPVDQFLWSTHLEIAAHFTR